MQTIAVWAEGLIQSWNEGSQSERNIINNLLGRQRASYYVARNTTRRHGGPRNHKYSILEQWIIEVTAHKILVASPLINRTELVRLISCITCNGFGKNLSTVWVNRMLRRWKWRSRVAEFKNIRKYEWENLLYYGRYLFWRMSLNDVNIKFMDECSFEGKELRRRNALGPRGRQFITTQSSHSFVTYSLFAVCDPNGTPPVVISDPHSGTFSGGHFLQFVVLLCLKGVLGRGEVLVLDNARTHFSRDIRDPLIRIQSIFRFRLVFLPVYSPELSPVELVFAKVKDHLRRRSGDGTFKQEIISAFNSVTSQDVRHLQPYQTTIQHLGL